MQDSCGNFGGTRETDCHTTNSRICLCRGMHNWRGIGKIDFPLVKWMLFKTIAESFSNYQKNMILKNTQTNTQLKRGKERAREISK